MWPQKVGRKKQYKNVSNWERQGITEENLYGLMMQEGKIANTSQTLGHKEGQVRDMTG